VLPPEEISLPMQLLRILCPNELGLIDEIFVLK
jgi:hypothetical protein